MVMILARVNIWDFYVGSVLWNTSTLVATFEFDDEFIKLGYDLSPLQMPLSNLQRGEKIFTFSELSKQTYYGLPGMLADSLPDKFGNEIIDAWLARQGRTPNSMNPVERLCYIGKRGMGALEYEPAYSDELNIDTALELDELVSLAKKALDIKNGLKVSLNDTDGLLKIIKVGTSAGGARAKAIIAYNELTNEVRTGQSNIPEGFKHWILKLDGVTNDSLGDPKGYGRIEYAYYLMAIDCGIEMMPSRLLEENSRAHFMTQRFDRINQNEKLHMQTLCGLAHYDYNQPTLYNYEQAFQVMRELRLSHEDATQLFRRMVFNVVAINNDDHTKNISFLLNKNNEWKLSPAYDVTYAYNPENLWLSQHQLSINGKRNHIELGDLLKVAKEISLRDGKNIVKEICSVVKKWNKFGLQAGIPQTQIEQIGNLHLTAIVE